MEGEGKKRTEWKGVEFNHLFHLGQLLACLGGRVVEGLEILEWEILLQSLKGQEE